MSKLVSCIGGFIAKALNISVLPTVLVRRLTTVCLLVLCYDMFEPLQSKTFGTFLPIALLSIFAGARSFSALLAGRLKHLNLYLIRNVSVVTDVIAIIGLLCYGIIGDETGAYIFIVCMVVSTTTSCPFYSVYGAEVSEWVRVTAGDMLKEFEIAQDVYLNLMTIIAMVVVSIMSILMPTDILALVIGAIFTAINVYSWKVMTDTINSIMSEEFQLKKKAIADASKKASQ